MLAKKQVKFFDYQGSFSKDKQELLTIIENVIDKGAFIMQSELSAFEEKLAKYVGAKYAVGVANATDGLQMLLMAGGIEAGDEVIFCSHTMVATASAIYFAGGIPIPVDAAADHLIDPNAIEKAITPKTKAIVVTQLNGRTANMDAIQNIASKHNLDIYEDAAQALGSKFKNKCAGNFGIGGCISFYPAKVLGCLGDGGAVICNDDKIYENLLLLRDHGRDKKGDVVKWGFNSRLDNMQAAILSHYLDDYQNIIAHRRKLAARYNENLKDLADISLLPAPDSTNSTNSDSNADHFDIFQNYEIEANDRDNLKAFLAKNNIGTLVQWGGEAVHQFKKLGFNEQLPATEQMFKRLLMLPLNMMVTIDDVDYVCEAVKKFYQ